MQKQESFEKMRTLRQRLNKRINRLLTRFYTLKGMLRTSAKKDQVQTLNTVINNKIQDRIRFENPLKTVLA
jgi:hypothetical protein